MQTLLGWTAETAGLWTSPRGIGTAALMPLVGYLLGKNWDGRWMLVLGFVTTSLAFFGYSAMNLNSGTWDIFWHQINQGAGMAFVFVPLTTLTMDPIPRQQMGYATSLYSVMRNIGSSMGISFVTTLVARRSQFHQSVLAAHVTPYDESLHLRLSQARNLFFQGGADWSTAGQQAIASLYESVQRQAALLSFVEAFRIMGILFLLCTGFVLLMRRPKHAPASPAVRPLPRADKV
jgi:DHA2 family multidrug resistance protein